MSCLIGSISSCSTGLYRASRKNELELQQEKAKLLESIEKSAETKAMQMVQQIRDDFETKQKRINNCQTGKKQPRPAAFLLSRQKNNIGCFVYHMYISCKASNLPSGSSYSLFLLGGRTGICVTIDSTVRQIASLRTFFKLNGSFKNFTLRYV